MRVLEENFFDEKANFKKLTILPKLQLLPTYIIILGLCP